MKSKLGKVTVTRLGECKDWKDRMCGWAKYRVTILCERCGLTVYSQCEGVYDDLKNQRPLCDKCEEYLDALETRARAAAQAKK